MGFIVVFMAPLLERMRRPDSVEPGTVMPTLGVGEQEACDISPYLLLETATSRFGPPRPLSPSLLHRD